MSIKGKFVKRRGKKEVPLKWEEPKGIALLSDAKIVMLMKSIIRSMYISDHEYEYLDEDFMTALKSEMETLGTELTGEEEEYFLSNMPYYAKVLFDSENFLKDFKEAFPRRFGESETFRDKLVEES